VEIVLFVGLVVLALIVGFFIGRTDSCSVCGCFWLSDREWVLNQIRSCKGGEGMDKSNNMKEGYVVRSVKRFAARDLVEEFGLGESKDVFEYMIYFPEIDGYLYLESDMEEIFKYLFGCDYDLGDKITLCIKNT